MSGAASGAPYVAVVGPGDADAATCALAEQVGEELARLGAVVVTGGLGGVMEAAARGAWRAGGATLGVLPGDDRSAGNAYLTLAVATGMGELRNGLVVRAADVLVAVGGAYGTLSEIALALKLGRRVVGLGTWEIRGVEAVADPASAAAAALR